MSSIGAIVGGSVAAAVTGFTWAGLAAAVVGALVGALVALLGIFLFYLVRSPQVLDEERRLEIDGLKGQVEELNAAKVALESELDTEVNNHSRDIQKLNNKNLEMWDTVRAAQNAKEAFERERNALKSRLEEYDRPKLILEIDQSAEEKIFAVHDRYRYVIKVFLKASIISNHEGRSLVEGMVLSLHEITQDGEEKEIPSEHSRNVEASEHERANLFMKPVNWKIGLPFDGIGKSFYDLRDDVGVSSEDGARLDKDCLLRLTMYVMNQPPYSADIYLNWEEARKSTGARIIPKTKVLYRVQSTE